MTDILATQQSRSFLDVAESQLVKIGARKVLLIKRFDRQRKHRVHFASARTMLLAEGIAEDAMGYADLADFSRRLSATPKNDCHQLFRRMAFNVLIENTDDHAKNHAFLFQDGQWRLSPAYDIQPQLLGIGYHQLRIGKEGHVPTLPNVLSQASRFILKRDEAAGIMDEMIKKTSDWQAVFAAAGVAQHDIDNCVHYMLRCLPG